MEVTVADTIVYGFTEPRIYTQPLVKELTPKTSRGFEIIDFARDHLKVTLFPWQEWLLIHMFELDAFGLLRFRKGLVIVGRQNGKTLIGAVLAAFWIYVDAGRWPEQLREFDFVVVGAAQKLDIAMKPWKQVRRWGAPDDKKIGVAPDRVPMLQEFTYPPRMVNGEVELKTHGGATYKPRTFDGARGESAARLLLDELRQQYDYEGLVGDREVGERHVRLVPRHLLECRYCSLPCAEGCARHRARRRRRPRDRVVRRRVVCGAGRPAHRSEGICAGQPVRWLSAGDDDPWPHAHGCESTREERRAH
ncbi:hypothetical protein JM654_03930 [Microbacterium oxydans]|nr:hypothetical protein [Microbacterium oxydans]